jgi:chaperonin GroES
LAHSTVFLKNLELATGNRTLILLQGDLMTFRPLQDRVVVRHVDPEQKTAGGIFISDTAQEKP